jgi:cytochrome c-type biogenesis protein CcmH
MIILRAFILSIFLLQPALAIDPGEALSDPQLETRARALSLELRCLVCQNQSIDDSDAELARDLRQFVRQRLLAGETDGQIREAVVARYGEFVLFRPQFAPHTFLLWATPLLIMLIGGFWAYRMMRNPSSNRAETRLD